MRSRARSLLSTHAVRAHSRVMFFSRRFDGRLVTGLDGNRRIMPFLMPRKNESVVYFEQTLDLTRAQPFLNAQNAGRPPERPAHLFHLYLAALGRTLHAHPSLNRFVSGSRIYQREGVFLSFAVKPERTSRSPLSVRKLAVPADEPFGAWVDRVYAQVGAARSGERSASDREAALFTKLPAGVLARAVRALERLDALSIAPKVLLETDPMYASAFVANLGSLGMEAAYHHLYEHGNCPVFAVLGRAEKIAAVADDDSLVARAVMRVRYSYDERIDDGLAAGRALAHLQRLFESPHAWAC